MKPYYADERVVLHSGDSLAVLAGLDTGSASAVVTDATFELTSPAGRVVVGPGAS